MTLSKAIFIAAGVLCYALIILAFNYGLQKAKKAHNVDFAKVKTEIPNGILLRGICSLIYYFFLVDWIFGFRLLPWLYMPFPAWVNWAGFVLLVLDTAFFWWIQIVLGSNYHGPLYLHENHELITSGPYRLIRHPTYLAFPLLHISLFLMTSNIAILIAGLVMSIYVNHIRIGYEEKLLLERFGDRYRDYMAKTGRYLPKIIKG